MTGYLRRLATTGAAYTASSVISKLIAVALLPLYTRYLTPADYGAAEVLVTGVIAASIVIRLGIIEALLRFYYRDDEDPDRVISTSFAALFWFATIAALIARFSRDLERPIYDRTGLSGKFDIALHWAPPMSASAGEPGPASDPEPSIFEALQSQLGLKLEPKKAAVEVLVVDSAQKVPVEN